MRKIDWFEIVDFYNSVFDTEFVQVKAMLSGGYKKFYSIEIFADKLGISREALRLEMKRLKIKLNRPSIRRKTQSND